MKKVIILAISGFTPAINLGDSNYIHVGELALRVNDPNDYAQITWQLHLGDKVNVYGLGTRSEEFKIVGGTSGSYTAYQPVLIPRRIDRCSNNCDDVYTILYK